MISPVNTSTRRHWLSALGGGLGALALRAMWADELVANEGTDPSQQKPSRSSHPPRATRVIWLFMHGGPSHVDLFDPKPALVKYAGKHFRSPLET